MAGYSIGETAERSGFRASTLRYNEDIELLRPARNDGGYRVYDEAALARLAFIGRAKQLGCALDEIRNLVAPWEDDRCGPVQQRFLELVTAKRTAAPTKIVDLADLGAFVAAEQRCCPFSSFTITVDHRGFGLEVDAPDDANELVNAMFGGPSDRGGAADARE